METELKLYDTGGHGCGLGVGTSAEGWLDAFVEFVNTFESVNHKKAGGNIMQIIQK